MLALMLVVLTFRVGAAQLHAIGREFAGPWNVNVAVTGQTVFGIDIVTDVV